MCYVSACVHVCVRLCMCARVRAWVHACAFLPICACACTCGWPLFIYLVKKICQNEKTGARTLHRAETVIKGMGCNTVILPVPHHRENLHKWCERQGYRENGGRSWPDSNVTRVCLEVFHCAHLIKWHTCMHGTCISMARVCWCGVW
jgi:hypothetical protein